ncbi:hypothetical protein R1sor_006160 [Riccia sorocarpa]|uniref:Uncharacterized protein n=1 Tax=Riccia sorocarpa TaxID=122646 RepID=A0ABD3HT49_9MARC
MKEEDPFNVSHDRFESGEEDDVIAQAQFVEPSSKVDGLVLDTSRTKKQKEARQSSKAEEEKDTGGNTPTEKGKEQRNPRSCIYNLFHCASSGVRRKFDWLIAETLSYLNFIREGRTRSAKKQTTKEKAPKQLKKKRDEPAEAEPVPETETPVPEVDPIVPEAGTSSPAVEEEATGHDKSVQKEDARQKKRSKKQANMQLVYEGCFREDVYFPMKNRCVIVKSSLKETHDLLHGNKTKTIKYHVPIDEELKKICAALDSRRAGGFLMNKKQVLTAADCLYLDLPTGLKIDEDDTVHTWNIFPGEDDLPRKLMGLGRIILDDRGCLIILHRWTLRSAQQIADALDAYNEIWKHVTTFDVQSDLPQFDEHRNYKGAGEQLCKPRIIVGDAALLQKQEKNAFDSLQRVLGSLHQPAKANPEPSAEPQKSLGKKPLGDDDDLGDIFGYHE